jgi:hypothetical protein
MQRREKGKKGEREECLRRKGGGKGRREIKLGRGGEERGEERKYKTEGGIILYTDKKEN